MKRATPRSKKKQFGFNKMFLCKAAYFLSLIIIQATNTKNDHPSQLKVLK